MTTATSSRTLILHSTAASVLSLIISTRFFPGFTNSAASGLIALALTTTMQRLLEQNRQAIWQEAQSPWRANARLAQQFALLFFGVCFAAILLDILHPDYAAVSKIALSEAYRNDWSGLLAHNSAVLLGCTVLGALYGAGGLMLVLAWNALHWAVVIYHYVHQIYDLAGVTAGIMVALALLPHLITELLAYVLSGLAGVFATKGISRYSLSDPALVRVLRACATMMIMAGLLLISAVSLEIFIGQPLFYYYSEASQ